MVTVYVTAPIDEAQSIAATLVEERLAACVNRVPCRSTYRWDGAIHTDDEEILLIKTTAERYPALVDRVTAVHPHEVPCIERFDETDVHLPFAAWRERAVDDEPAVE